MLMCMVQIIMNMFIFLPSFMFVMMMLAAARVELHVHLDGAIAPQTLFDIATARNLTLPLVGRPKSVSDIDRLLAAQTPFGQFDVVNDIVGGDTWSLQLVAERFVHAQAAVGVNYTEVR